MEKIFASSCQYGDIKGNLTIDGQMGANLHEYAEKNNIDTNKYFPIGINIDIGENECHNIDIIAIDKSLIGLGITHESIRIYLEENDTPNLKKFNVPNGTLHDYLKICKRLSISATTIPELINQKINLT